MTVLLGSRDAKSGEAAAQSLRLPNVRALQVDITDSASLARAAEDIAKIDGGRLSLIVHNAGMAFKGDAFDADVVDTTLRTNYYGTLNAIRAFLPVMHDGARIVNVSSASSVSALRNMSAELRAQFLDPSLSVDGLTALLQQFRSAVASGTWKEQGWPNSAYGMSKVGVSCLTQIMARNKELPRSITINCGCPGWCRTDMAGDKAPRSAEEGAADLVHICLLPEGDKSNGEFFENKKVSSLTRPAQQ